MKDTQEQEKCKLREDEGILTEELHAAENETKLTEFAISIRDEYQKIDSEHTLELILDKEHLDLILTVGFGIPYHKVSTIRTDGGTVKLILEKI